MGKNKGIAGRDNMQRINYLYQASNLILSKKVLTSSYCNLALNIAKKTVQRIDVSVKRTICKGCHILLVSGINARSRIRKKILHIVCLQCNTRKKYDLKNYRPIWSECPEAILEIICD